MLTKKIGLLATTLVMCASNISFTGSNQGRYEVIAVNFSPELKRFDMGFLNFLKPNQDIDIVQEHKQILEKKVAEYKASWAPIALKAAAIGFGIGAGSNVIAAFLNVLPRYDYYTTYCILEDLNGYLRYASLDTDIGIFGKACTKLYDLQRHDLISAKARDLGRASLRIGDSLITASIATWLFKKAISYQEEIAKLQEEIAVDDQMVQALQNLNK